MQTTTCSLLPPDANVITPLAGESLVDAFNRSATLVETAPVVYVATDTGQCVPFSRFHSQEAVDQLNDRVIGDSTLAETLLGDDNTDKLVAFSSECQSNLGVATSIGCMSKLQVPVHTMVAAETTTPCTQDSALGACVGGAIALPSLHSVNGRWVSELDDMTTPTLNPLAPGKKSLCTLYLGEDLTGSATSVPIKTCNLRGDCMTVLRMHKLCADNDTTRDVVRDALDSCRLPVCEYAVNSAYADERDPTIDEKGDPRPADQVDPQKVAEYQNALEEAEMLAGMCSTLDAEWCAQMAAPKDLCRTIYDNPAAKAKCEATIETIEKQRGGIAGKLCPTVTMRSQCSSMSLVGQDTCSALEDASRHVVKAGADADEVAGIVNNDILSCGNMKPTDDCASNDPDSCKEIAMCKVNGDKCESVCPFDLDTCTQTDGCIVAGGMCMKKLAEADDGCQTVAGTSELECSSLNNSCTHHGSSCVRNTSYWDMGIDIPDGVFLAGKVAVAAAVSIGALAAAGIVSRDFREQVKSDLNSSLAEATSAGEAALENEHERAAQGNIGDQKSGVGADKMERRTAATVASDEIDRRIESYETDRTVPLEELHERR